jgi:hypothetical protein
MKRSRRWWQRERNDVARAERREAVREAGAHTRWKLTFEQRRSIADYANVYGLKCPRSFRAYATGKEPPAWVPAEELPF